jgi:hypothetical protein
MHRNFVDEAPLARDSVQVPDQENSEEHFWVDGRPAVVTVQMLGPLPNESQINVPVDGTQQMVWRDQLVDRKVVK